MKGTTQSHGTTEETPSAQLPSSENPFFTVAVQQIPASYQSLLTKLIMNQLEFLKAIGAQNQVIGQKVNSITNLLMSARQGPSLAGAMALGGSITPRRLMEFLAGPNPKFTHKLKLLSEMPSPVYKERAFSLSIQIFDKNDIEVTLPCLMRFKVMLFTYECPPKMLKVNTSGDKIMRGSITAEGNSTILFRKIVVKEVTSHFRNGCLFLIIACDNASHIQPLIIEDVVIKARKVFSQKSKKKPKTEEDHPEDDAAMSP